MTFGWGAPAAAQAGRYQLGSAADGTTFVLDSASGRVWRYEKSEDAWYLYDLEALVKVPHGASARDRTPSPREPGGSEGHRQPGGGERSDPGPAVPSGGDNR